MSAISRRETLALVQARVYLEQAEEAASRAHELLSQVEDMKSSACGALGISIIAADQAAHVNQVIEAAHAAMLRGEGLVPEGVVAPPTLSPPRRVGPEHS